MIRYKPRKELQYTYARKIVRKRNSTETLVSDVSYAQSELEERNAAEQLEIIGHDEHAEEDEHSDEDELKGSQLQITRQQQKLKRIMDMTKANW